MKLTMLSGLLETGEEIQLNIHIFRRLGKADLVPSLRCRPSACFAVVEGLLVQSDVLEVS